MKLTLWCIEELTYSSSSGDGHVLQLVLPVVSEARCLHSDHLQPDLQPVEDQGAQSFSVHVLGHDDQWFAVLVCDLQGGHDALDAGDLLLAQQQVGILELDLLT